MHQNFWTGLSNGPKKLKFPILSKKVVGLARLLVEGRQVFVKFLHFDFSLLVQVRVYFVMPYYILLVEGWQIFVKTIIVSTNL